MSTYTFIGHDAVGSYVARQLEGSFERVDAVQDADIIVTYATHSSALEDVYFEEGGVVRSAGKGALTIDLSPSTPALSRDISAVATVNGLRPVEAPLAVLDATAKDAFAGPENFVCYASGEDEDLDAAREVLERLAGLVKRTGESGTAQLVKATHTAQQCAQLVATIEADALRRAVVAANPALAKGTVALEPLSDIADHALAAIEAGAYEGTYTVELMMADVVAAMSAADDVEIILPQLESAMHLLEMLAVIGGADYSPAALVLLHSDEQACKDAGLDWTRAEQLFAEEHDHDHGHDHHHHHGHGDYDDFDSYDDYDDYDEQFEFGGFGVYSEN